MYSNEIVCKILMYIDKNINDRITIKDLSDKFFYNRYYIMKLFKKEMDMTIVDYINSVKIYNSLKLLKQSNNKMLNVALNSGFNSLEYYSEIFKKIVGESPKQVSSYFNGDKKITTKQIKNINTAYVELYNLMDKKEKYLKNRIPLKLPVKTLSIFK